MNQIERTVGHNYHLRLWSNAVYEVDTSQIKRLLDLVAQQLGFDVEVDAYYYDAGREWRINFTWIESGVSRRGFQHNADHSQIVCANAAFLERLAFDLGDRITKFNTSENQNWILVRWREGFLTGIHQAGKTSVNLILREVTQDGDLATNHTRITVEARNPGNTFIRGDSVEVDGMLLQGELLEWLEIGEESWFRFSPNTHEVNTSGSSLDERITFTTRPRTPRMSLFEQVRPILEQQQLEILRSSFFDRWLEPPPHLGRSIELPSLRRGEEVITPSIESIISSGRWQRYDDTHADSESEYEGLGLRTCEYNAKSKYLRCTVKPSGPCQGCQHYEKL